ncbi:hypothetical protein LTR29_013509 [Friedmanniomyces endolithicus]|nr:hypothetical protein LTS09_001635 [Friedmanniomyces endolithicus]KAK0308318.1 hypothetical protein LTR01_004945 [Friedmanniomyces endolithicus]KAK0827821.1 hypothetical protein LTR73_005423 [Friedmanniomyces endolithicus]KAK0934940.1 hypothetical protein LTR29_013509 [Friedmanniomyces endolithicus]
MMKRGARISAPPRFGSDHGRYIYAYCNIRTNQVVYSLTHTLNSHAAIKQLPDIGANYTPTHIRKDIWRPLWTLALPVANPHSRAQGLHAFKKLREYRRLHELTWKPSLALTKPYTDVEVELEQKKLDQRGGSKKENVYDVIKRRKWALRVRTVMDQKATSIADLAAVLLEQEEIGRKTTAKREVEVAKDRRVEVKEILALAREYRKQGIGGLESELEGVRSRLENKEPDSEGMSKGMLRREQGRLMGRIARIQFAADAVAKLQDPSKPEQTLEVKADTEAEADGVAESGDTSTTAPAHTEDAPVASEPASSSTEPSTEPATPTTERRTIPEWSALLPSFPPVEISKLPKLSPLRAKLQRLRSPIHSADNVTVIWKDLLDAEFAGLWPDGVVHERMDIVGKGYSPPRGSKGGAGTKSLGALGVSGRGPEQSRDEEESEQSAIRSKARAERGERAMFVNEIQRGLVARMMGRERTKTRGKVDGLRPGVSFGVEESKGGEGGILHTQAPLNKHWMGR